MSFIAGIAEKVVSGVTSSIAPKKVLDIATDAYAVFREVEDVVLFPEAKLCDKVVNFFFPKNRKLAKAAKAVLLFENYVAIRCQMEAVKGAAISFAEKCEGARPLPVRALQQKETYAPELRKDLKIKFICAAPAPVATAVLRCDQMADATGKLVKESALFGKCMLVSAAIFFGGPFAKKYSKENLVTSLARLKATIAKDPQVFAQDLKSLAKHIDRLLQWVGVSYKADDLIKNILGEKKISPQEVKPPPGALDQAAQMAMRAVFSLINMTTDLQCPLPCIEPSDAPQPVSTYRSDDASVGSTSAPRAHKNDERRFL